MKSSSRISNIMHSSILCTHCEARYQVTLLHKQAFHNRRLPYTGPSCRPISLSFLIEWRRGRSLLGLLAVGSCLYAALAPDFARAIDTDMAVGASSSILAPTCLPDVFAGGPTRVRMVDGTLRRSVFPCWFERSTVAWSHRCFNVRLGWDTGSTR